MNLRSKYRGVLLALMVLLGFMALGQGQEGIDYKIVGTDLYCYIDRTLSEARIDSVLETCDLNADQLTEMHQAGTASASGWVVHDLSPTLLTLKKPLHHLSGKPADQRDIMDLASAPPKASASHYRFGYNIFSKPAVRELENGKTRFFLAVKGSPNSVFLSGTFNDWSTSALPMQACDSGFYAEVALAQGAHYYKFIVNGHWFMDPRNKLKEIDQQGNENSVYFKENHCFELEGYAQADEVQVAGSFNNWQADPQGFLREGDTWKRPCFIEPGTHAYKFIVDGQWILDPANPVTRSDGMGNENSFMAIGDTFYFYLPGHLDEPGVYVAGDFNEWNPSELKMDRTDSGWVLPYVLAPGNYEYKFVLGMGYKWILDPLNPIRNGEEPRQNSVISIGANQHFFYPKVAEVEHVYLSGDFNAWPEHGYRMEPQADGWYIDVYLPEGKTRYKFIVGDKWLRDPNNPLFEPNEYQGFNSVIWIK